ncbi:hypothetical protein [Dactylosporangium salmoneum]|uniref:Roadblock/LAMTOR2 domain-containing protein n=1 Tax=Dactylosporangium salmoneum TaxID=53361 RepID=A0ABP5TWI4_9ACTN
MDETGQAGSPDAAGAYPGTGPGLNRGRAPRPESQVNGATGPSDDALEAIVSAWREPPTGAIAGRAVVNGNGNGVNGNGINGNGINGNGGSRGRAEVRSPYSDMLAPMSPPVSAPPPPQPPTSTLHYGHYGPDGQGWPTSSQTGESKSVPAAPPPGTVYGALSVENSGETRRPVSGQPAFEAAPPQRPYDQQPYEYEQPQYEQAPSALDRVAEQQQAGQSEWGYRYRQYQQGQQQFHQEQQYQQEQQFHQEQQYQQQEQQYQPYPQEQPVYQQEQPAYQQEQPAYQQEQPAYSQEQPAYSQEQPVYQPQGPAYQQEQRPYQPEQRHWAPEPAQPEFDWASPTHSPVQHEPEVPRPATVPLPEPTPPQPQPVPAQRMPENDPLVGPLPPVLLGSAAAMAPAEPVMPTFADDMPQPEYDPLELPQRVPSEPDVPPVPAVEPQPVAVGAPELTRITNKLREDEDGGPESPDDRPDGFDVQSVLRAVQTVSGVHRATLRQNADGLHTLRLELADEADAGQVSRIVARMLNDTMGLSAEQNPLLPDEVAPAPAPADESVSTVTPPRPPARPHSALPGYGREARRRRPVSTGARRPTEPKAPALTPNPGAIVSPRVVIESVDVNTQGIDATVEVRLTADNQPAIGVASGPNFDGYMLKLAALAAASAIDQLLVDSDASIRARCYIEHAAVVALGGCEVAVVVLLLMYDGFVEQLTGSAVVSGDGDSRQAVVRATMAAVNRRLEALLP